MGDELDEEWWQIGENKGSNKLTKLRANENGKNNVNKLKEHVVVGDKIPKKSGMKKAAGASTVKSNKRKLPTTDEGSVIKRKRRKKTKLQEVANSKTYTDSKEEFLNVLNTYFDEHLSPVEKEELKIEESHVIKLTMDKEDTWATGLQKKLPKLMKCLKKNMKIPGSPVVLVLSASALRILHLKRDLETLTPECKIPKLFAKHIKIKEQQKFLSNNVIKIGIGTPHRVAELIALASLTIDRLRYVAIDWTFRDEKLRRAIDITETKTAMIQLLVKHLLPKTVTVNTKIVLV